MREQLMQLGEDIDGPEFRVSGGGKKRRRLKRYCAIRNIAVSCVYNLVLDDIHMHHI